MTDYFSLAAATIVPLFGLYLKWRDSKRIDQLMMSSNQPNLHQDIQKSHYSKHEPDRSLRAIVLERQLELHEIVKYSSQICRTLYDDHQKNTFDHTSISPENITINTNDDVQILRTDTDSKSHTIYVSPEQLHNKKIDTRSDIFILGLLMFEMATQHHPFADIDDTNVLQNIRSEHPKPIASYRPDISGNLQGVISKALQKEKRNRYKNMPELMENIVGLEKEPKGRKSFVSSVMHHPFRFAFALSIIFTIFWITKNIYPGFEFDAPIIASPFSEAFVISNIDNSTEDSTLNRIFNETLRRELMSSGFVNFVSQKRRNELLQMIRVDPDTTMDKSLACRIAFWDGDVRAIIASDVSRVSKMIYVSAELLNPECEQIGATLAEGAGSLEEISNATALVVHDIKKRYEKYRDRIDPGNHVLHGIATSVSTSNREALILYRQGMQKNAQMRFREARNHLEDAVELDSTFPTALAALARVNWCLEHFSKAQSLGLQVSAIIDLATPKEQYWIRSIMALITGDYRTASQELSSLVDLFPYDVQAQADLGESYLLLGEYDIAYNHLIKADSLNPGKLPILRQLLSMELSYKRDLEKAIALKNIIMEIAPDIDFAPIYLVGALKQIAEGDWEGADQEFDSSLASSRSLSPSTETQVRLEYSNSKIINGQFDDAMELLEDARHAAARDEDATLEGFTDMQIALLKRRLGDTVAFRTQMFGLLNQTFDESIAMAAAWLAFGDASSGRTWLANRFLEILLSSDIESHQKEACSLLITGALHQHQKNYSDAIRLYKQAIRRYPNMFLTRPHCFFQPMIGYESLAQAYEQRGEIDLAIATWDSIINHKGPAISGFTGDPFCWVKAHYHLAMLYKRQNKPLPAIKKFENFLGYWGIPDTTLYEVKDALYHLGTLYEQQLDYDSALSCYDKFLSYTHIDDEFPAEAADARNRRDRLPFP